MTLSVEAATLFQEIQFTSAVTPPTVTSSTKLANLSPGANANSSSDQLGDQVIEVTATLSDANGSATLVFFKADNDSVGSNGAGKIFQDTATMGVTTTRQSLNTAAGDYVATVQFAISGKNTLDLGRYGKAWPAWYVGCTALSGTSVTLRFAPLRAI